MNQEKILRYFEVNPGLKVLFVFEDSADSLFGKELFEEIESFWWPSPYRSIRFNGDWFATKYELAHLKENERIILLMPMRSPLRDKPDAMARFPLLGELCANQQYSAEDYRSFMLARNLPDSVSRFVASHISLLQLQKFDKVLAPHYDATFTPETGYRGLISVLLDESSLRGWQDIFFKLFIIDGEVASDPQKSPRFFQAIQQEARYSSVKNVLQERLKRDFGTGFNAVASPHMADVAKRLRYNTIVQDIPVKASDNYKTLRIADRLVIDRMNAFLEQAANLPDKPRNQFFRALGFLSSGIQAKHLVDVYGVDAAFGSYPPNLAREVLLKLASSDIKADAAHIKDRADFLASRIEAGRKMRSVAEYLSSAALLSIEIGKPATFQLDKPKDYIVEYSRIWYGMDRFYRQSLEAFYKIEDDDRLLVEKVKKILDESYALCIAEMNTGWMKSVCGSGGTQDIEGFLKQGEIFARIGDVSAKHVVIISDALRYEVAKEIEERINALRHEVTTTAAIAVMPTETKFTKDLFLPHNSSTIQADGDEPAMRIDGALVKTIQDRTAILSRFWADAMCVDFKWWCQHSQTEKRELCKRPLVYIYHDAIDHASHGAKGRDVVGSCRKAVEELTDLVKSLHSTYNVSDVMLLADHGFLLNDIDFDSKDKIQVPSEENPKEKTTRYYLTHSTAKIHGVAKFPMAAVSTSVCDLTVSVPVGVSRFAASGGYEYAHGGASLQEIVIPVVRSRYQRPNTKNSVNVTVVEQTIQVLSSQMSFNLLQIEAVSSEMKSREVACALYSGDSQVSEEKTVVLDSTSPNPHERKRKVSLTMRGNPGASVLKLKVFDSSDKLNPLVERSVTNNTLVERDF